jgi:hypothetical protein
MKDPVTLLSAKNAYMDKSKNVRKSKESEDLTGERIPDPGNPLVERFDEADPLNDRAPSGDSGPEDAEKKKGPAPGSMTFY